jgi:hypothetical protein
VVQVGNNCRELLLRLLVEVRDCNACSEDGIIGMGNCHVCSSFGGLEKKLADEQDASERVAASAELSAYKIVEFYRRDTLVDTGNDLLRDCCCIDMFGVEAITQTRDSGCDLVELDTLLASICGFISWCLYMVKVGYTPRFHTYMMAT